MANDHGEQIRIVQETVAGKEITFAHVIGFIGIDLAVDIIFSDAAGNQLIVLSAKVQHDDSFMLHDVFLHF